MIINVTVDFFYLRGIVLRAKDFLQVSQNGSLGVPISGVTIRIGFAKGFLLVQVKIFGEVFLLKRKLHINLKFEKKNRNPSDFFQQVC